MTFKIADRIHETTTTTGTGTINLGGAVAGAQTFLAGIGTGNTTFYVIADDDDWEVGVGTVTSGTPNTLSRTTVLSSSNGGALVNWVTGTRNVFCGLPADKVLVKDDLGHVGIGKTPVRELDVFGAGNVYIRVDASTSSDAAIEFAENNVLKFTIRHDASADTLSFGQGAVTSPSAFNIDANDNAGFGVTPESWYSSAVAMHIGERGVIYAGRASASYNGIFMMNNSYIDVFPSFKAIASGPATFYAQQFGSHGWYTASTVAADASVSFRSIFNLDADGNVIVGSDALATDATDGFLYIPSCPGTPTGTPTGAGSSKAMVYDSTNNKIYIYDGGWIGTAALT